MKTPALALAALLFLGCSSDGTTGPDCEQDGEQCDGNGGIVPTFNGNLTAYNGYHKLFDKTVSQCVEVDKSIAQGKQFVVDSDEPVFELRSVVSRDEIATELGVDLGLKVKYLTTSGDASMNMVRTTKTSNTTINLLLKVRQSYVVRNKHPMMLSSTGLTKLRSGADKFVAACGTHYVNGIRYGADLYLLLTIEAQDEQTANELKTSLGISGGAGALIAKAEISGEVKTKLSNSLSKSGVRAEARVLASGFELPGGQLVGELLGGPVTAEKIQQIAGKVAEISKQMQDSVADDAKNDAADHLNNPRRKARATGVDLGFYDALPNAEFTGASPFAQIKDRTLIIERFIRDWAELEERMESVYRNEVEAFTKAADKAAYQIAPPAAPVRTPNDVVAIVDRWTNEFFPDSGTQIGTTYEIASNTTRDCWEKASVSFGHQCAPNDQAGTETQPWKDVLAKIEQYGREGRVLPLQYKVHEAIAHRQLADACSEFNANGVTYRPPTLDEVPLLAPLVGFGAIEWDGDAPNETWFTHPSPASACDPASGFPNPYFRHNPADGKTEIKCGDADGTVLDGREINVICVPTNGPLPLVQAP